MSLEHLHNMPVCISSSVYIRILIGIFIDKYNYEIKIPHQGAVKSAQYMPSNTNLIATKSDNDLFIYDISECKDDVDCNNGEILDQHIIFN